MIVVAKSRFVGTDLKEGTLLFMISWKKESTHKSNWKKKPTLVLLMSSHWFVTMNTAMILKTHPNGVPEGCLVIKKESCRGYASRAATRRS